MQMLKSSEESVYEASVHILQFPQPDFHGQIFCRPVGCPIVEQFLHAFQSGVSASSQARTCHACIMLLAPAAYKTQLCKYKFVLAV